MLGNVFSILVEHVEWLNITEEQKAKLPKQFIFSFENTDGRTDSVPSEDDEDFNNYMAMYNDIYVLPLRKTLERLFNAKVGDIMASDDNEGIDINPLIASIPWIIIPDTKND